MVLVSYLSRHLKAELLRRRDFCHEAKASMTLNP